MCVCLCKTAHRKHPPLAKRLEKGRERPCLLRTRSASTLDGARKTNHRPSPDEWQEGRIGRKGGRRKWEGGRRKLIGKSGKSLSRKPGSQEIDRRGIWTEPWSSPRRRGARSIGDALSPRFQARRWRSASAGWLRVPVLALGLLLSAFQISLPPSAFQPFAFPLSALSNFSVTASHLPRGFRAAQPRGHG